MSCEQCNNSDEQSRNPSGRISSRGPSGRISKATPSGATAAAGLGGAISNAGFVGGITCRFPRDSDFFRITQLSEVRLTEDGEPRIVG